MYFRRKISSGRAYLQIVESRRDGDQVRQQVIATLGRFDELQASGQLERLVRSGARFAAKAMVLSAASNDAAIEIAVRPIEGEHPYVYLDGIVLKRSWAGEVRNVSLLSGYRAILGICEGAKDWSEFLKHLKERGLKGVRLIISDACIGLAESAAEFFPEAAWQRCVVHWYRNIFSHVPSTKVREIAAMLKAIHASEDIAAAREKATRVIEKLRGLRLSRAAELEEAAVEETLAYYTFPEEHWRRIRTNNPLERILREIRRRTRVVGAFPDGQSALNLAAARLRHIAGTAWSTKRYLNIELLKDQQMRGAITA